MIPKLLSAMWTAIAPAMANHLWQSTLFVCVIALLTWALRNYRAQVRYGLWFAASVKFLVPFSLLAGIGSHLATNRIAPAAQTRLYFAMEQVGQPFTRQTIAPLAPAAPSTLQSLTHLLPALLLVWLSGFAVVLFVWCVRWRRISAAVRQGEPLREGREVDTLRRLESLGGMARQTQILSSRTSLEPGIFGITRPVLLWPQGITDRLEDEHLKSILAHELLHIHRRDNLAAAVHMVVEAAFWFHPLVWWMGTRLVQERERACDEQVLESGSDRQVYAESILKICEFCVGSTLPCVSGVTGAELKTRITRIMSDQVARKLDISRKLLLIAATILAIAAPIAAGVLHTAPGSAGQTQSTIAALPAYATVSITPSNSGGEQVMLMFGLGEFMSKNASLQQVVRAAYGVEDDRIIGAPSWLASDKYDVEAKEDTSEMSDPRKLGLDAHVRQQTRMLQAMLADRLRLAVHRETREIPILALLIAKNGPKFQDSDPGAPHPEWHKGPRGISIPGIWMNGNAIVGQGVGTNPLLFHLSRILHRTILDETGLSGTYDFTLKLPDGVKPGIDEPSLPETSKAAIFAVLEQQLGLKLELRKASMEVFVIDHVEKPLPNQNTTLTTPIYKVALVQLNKTGTTSLATGKGIIRQRLMINPGVFVATNASTFDLIRTAFGVKDYQISGAPDWFYSELYDVDAKAEKSVIDEIQQQGKDQRGLTNQRMAQALLEDRFKMTLHHETKNLPTYSLVVAEPGKLREAQGDCPSPSIQPLGQPGIALPPPPCGDLRVFYWVGHFDGLKVPVTKLVATLSDLTRTAVSDKTNLAGKYDINFEWAPEPSQFPPRPAYVPAPQPDPNREPLPTAIQKQLGLKLEPQTAPIDILMIDHVEKPSQN
jgi:bla regulator protein blaR1